MREINRFKDRYSFLSNFYLVQIRIGDRVWPSVENYFQAMKTSSFPIQEIIRGTSPRQAKKMGRDLFLRPDWEDVKDTAMMRGLREKFLIPWLFNKLIATGGANLIEGNYWHDNYWGNCTCDRCKDIVGKNKLGNMLMQIRRK